jgi:hypothetical protein
LKTGELMSFNVNSISGFDAQAAHVGWGAFSTLALSLWLPLWAAVVVSIGVWFTKEALEATGKAPWEPKQTWFSSLIDFGFFSIGIGSALGLHLLKY